MMVNLWRIFASLGRNELWVLLRGATLYAVVKKEVLLSDPAFSFNFFITIVIIIVVAIIIIIISIIIIFFYYYYFYYYF